MMLKSSRMDQIRISSLVQGNVPVMTRSDHLCITEYLNVCPPFSFLLQNHYESLTNLEKYPDVPGIRLSKIACQIIRISLFFQRVNSQEGYCLHAKHSEPTD